MLILTLLAAGCEERIETAYGGRTGSPHGPSVNGTAVFADMLAGGGHQVLSRTSLSPGLQDTADIIIWFPDDFHVPDRKVVAWLESWLAAGEQRTLVYVGRDFDAAIEYWEAVQPTAPQAQKAEVQRRLTQADAQFAQQRSGLVDGETCNWFSVKTLARPRQVTTLAGPFAARIDASQADLRLYSSYQFNSDDEVLLADQNEPLVVRRRFFSPHAWSTELASSQLLVVTNGSFLLNLPLVNHEHRKLAQQLINQLPPTSRVVFLESGPGGPPIHESEPAARPPNGLAVFSIWPLGGVLLHLAALGLLFCFARLPIFGVPRDPPEAALSDFGKHVSALGELLQGTDDRDYARARVEQYQQIVHGGGAHASQSQTHAQPKSPMPAIESRTIN